MRSAFPERPARRRSRSFLVIFAPRVRLGVTQRRAHQQERSMRMRSRRGHLWVAALLGVAVTAAAGCGGLSAVGSISGGSPSGPVICVQHLSSIAPDCPARASDELLRDGAAFLAERLGAEPEKLRLVAVRALGFRNTSMGCGDPDAVVGSSIVRGFIAQFARGDDLYVVHIGARKDAGRICIP